MQKVSTITGPLCKSKFNRGVSIFATYILNVLKELIAPDVNDTKVPVRYKQGLCFKNDNNKSCIHSHVGNWMGRYLGKRGVVPANNWKRRSMSRLQVDLSNDRPFTFMAVWKRETKKSDLSCVITFLYWLRKSLHSSPCLVCCFIRPLKWGIYFEHTFLWRLDLVHSADPCQVKTLPLGHKEWHDCSPMRCWRVMSCYVFLYGILHMCLSAGLAHFSLQGYRQLDAGCLGLKLQLNRPVMTLYF